MRKKLLVLLLCVCSFVAGICFSQLIPSSHAADDGINRVDVVLFPEPQYKWNRYVYVFTQTSDKYYHDDDECSYINPFYTKVPLEISEYEAVERRYTPCPNCYTPEVKIYSRQWDRLITH